ncbi:MAG: citrate synthase [Candidatus Scalindua sp. AMX11]|nr:MAG: citrate synthase [Candidatus Scalindua sp.]NOG84900.1 citrate synthase [Planctomycetota bacterium]RZV84966.1 MAG: citrate synthase [Candidatus Scalindua sp. SCAELEC01]TDE65040.1 MAG: citrate synthase [Candidatus Scalindua sp. AMX11]GJQ59432.1 MAG: citrate synthase [Candidatus Scalindua sp.]
MENVTIKFEDSSDIELPVVEGTEKERGIDITELRSETGYITLDPGYGNTGSCESSITYLNGEKGVLRYRGIPIEQLAEKSNFIEVADLLINGELPSKERRGRFAALLTDNALLHENLKHHFEGFPWNSHPMAMLSAMVNALSCYYPVLTLTHRLQDLEMAAAILISQIRTIAAFSYKMTRGEPFIYPIPKHTYSENLLHMMFSLPHEHYEVHDDIKHAVDRILILHADHEQNCSTSTVRMVASSGANLFAAISAGISALWGPLHGGANQAVVEMLLKIHKGKLDVKKCIEMAKDKDSNFRLMGFGHRVYKNFDPRAQILKGLAVKVFDVLKKTDPLVEIARELEGIALNDPYFVERNLYPNVDFYSGIILRAIGVPKNMFPVFFAIGRLPGWIAHWHEVADNIHSRIDRPRQIYTGYTERPYVPIEKRS